MWVVKDELNGDGHGGGRRRGGTVLETMGEDRLFEIFLDTVSVLEPWSHFSLVSEFSKF